MSGAIVAFLSDTTRSSLELPHMTTGQRKETKKLVEQYVELTCESYGFGQDRQLHLFKRRGDAASSAIVFGEVSCKVVPEAAAERSCKSEGPAGFAVSVKNTFVDDFVENSFADATHESRAVTTMPPALSRILLDTTSGRDAKCENEIPSTAASSIPSAADSPAVTPRAESDLPSPLRFASPSGLEVRNTFLHYAHSADERIVQSMPHGMFGQCLIADLLGDVALKKQQAAEPPASVPQSIQERPVVSPLTCVDDIAVDEWALAPGTEVVITGLSKLPAFNGLTGTIQSFDEETSRFSVLLIEPAGGHKWVKVKRDNLNLVVSLPPPLSPSSYFPEVQTTPTWDERPVAHSLSLTALV